MRRVFAVVAAPLLAAVAIGGCSNETGSGSSSPQGPFTMLLTGSVSGSPVTGSYRAVITTLAPINQLLCVPAAAEVTLTDAEGSVTESHAGLMCPVRAIGGYYVTTTWKVSGGTGAYAGATGGGGATIAIGLGVRPNDGFDARSFGTFTVPGQARSTGKREFRMHGTIERMSRLPGPSPRLAD